MKRNRKIKILSLVLFLLVALLFLKGLMSKPSQNTLRSNKNSQLEQTSFSLKSDLRPKLESPISENKSISLSSSEKLSVEQKAIICEFKKFGSAVPHQGKVRVHAAKFSAPYSGNSIWIKSSECPKDKFSILFFSDDGHISKEINCLDTTLTELMKFSGEQADVDYTPIDSSSVNLAISGPGYFVLRCPDDSLLITRAGNFKKDISKHLSNQKGCILLNENGQSLVASKIFGEKNGCSPEGDCIAIYEPGRDKIQGLEYLNSYSFTAKSGIMPSQSITKVGPKEFRPYFLINSLERLSDPKRGATGISWSEHAELDLNDIDCPN